MKTLLTFATVALAAAAFAAGPREGRGPMGPRGGMGGMEGIADPVVRMVTNPKVAEKIGLTDEQREKIKEINKTSRDNNEELRKSLRAAMEKQAELLKADTIDEAAVNAEIDKAFEARKEMAKRQTKRIIAIKAVLTPEQVKKVLEMAKEVKGRPMGERGPEARGPRGKGSRCKGGDCDKPCDGPKCKDGDKPEPPPECEGDDMPEEA